MLTSHGTRSQSQASVFDENLVNVSQFVHVTEAFMGEVPDMHVFGHMVRYIREGYMETEEERMKRLLQVSTVIIDIVDDGIFVQMIW